MSAKEAKPFDASSRVAEVLRLGLVEGVAVRAIAKRLHMCIRCLKGRPSEDDGDSAPSHA